MEVWSGKMVIGILDNGETVLKTVEAFIEQKEDMSMKDIGKMIFVMALVMKKYQRSMKCTEGFL